MPVRVDREAARERLLRTNPALGAVGLHVGPTYKIGQLCAFMLGVSQSG